MKTSGKNPGRTGTPRHFPQAGSITQPNHNERLRKLIESTDDWLWEVDEELHYTYASPQIQALLGYSPSEVLGKTPFDLMPPAEAGRMREDFMHMFDVREAFALLENINQHRNGKLVVLETSGKPFHDERGIFRGSWH